MLHGVGLLSEQLPKCLLHTLWGFPGSGVPQQGPGHTTVILTPATIAGFFPGKAVLCGSLTAAAVLELPTADTSMAMVLASTAYEGHETVGASLQEGHKVDKKSGAPHLQRQAEKVGDVEPGEDCVETSEQPSSI